MPDGRTPLRHTIGRFIVAYGFDTYFNPARWATRDGVIPFGVFFELSAALDSVGARQELAMALAFELGYALAKNGKADGVQRAFRTLKRRAFPIVEQVT